MTDLDYHDYMADKAEAEGILNEQELRLYCDTCIHIEVCNLETFANWDNAKRQWYVYGCEHRKED